MLTISLNCLFLFAPGQSKTDNSEKLSALGTQDEDKQNKTEGAIKNGQFRETVNIGQTI
jgi:hypothetical protein